MVELSTPAEIRAQDAERLLAFSGVKLLHIKRNIANLLGLIGRGQFFDEYTRHDIGHIDAVLHMLEWLIPDTTKSIMSPADWLLTVLAIYLHDLGLLVTRDEFESRHRSGFHDFRDSTLFAGEHGADYRARVATLRDADAERFLYQEFVRAKHAERIRRWVDGTASDHLGVTHVVVAEMADLLRPLSTQFRRDLALVCESHHLDDLNDVRKYRLSQPYGNSEAETANVQYAALLLRTADLLHITGDRTPSILFRTISPVDPISQLEWAKQMAVTRIRSRIGHDRDARPDDNAPRDTVEVHAYFTREDGFFGLTAYLLYAAEQLRKTHDWSKESNTLHASRHEFPWRFIDDSHVETEGFLRETFGFTLDQAKILDLLTGHTLYNDTTVVLRELVQNSLDAVRLQQHIDRTTARPVTEGRVHIRWSSQARTLSVQDNGTGMTQAIVETHLLRVGSSRYQDAQFKKDFPDFSSISRFGIGILSTFMIADAVEITTLHPEETQARRLALRSVHGRYLIRLVDKFTDPVAKTLTPHGTVVTLTVRPSADVGDVKEIARAWIVVPESSVTVQIDDDAPVDVGYDSPKTALHELAQRIGLRVSDEDTDGARQLRIEERTIGGVTVAYAVQWSEYFREWSFVSFPGWLADSEGTNLGTCIEGIRVSPETPGFTGNTILALANAKGPTAPKTNVARSGLELTPEREATLRSIYQIYCAHVQKEIEELAGRRAFSLTWATQESRFLLAPLLASISRGRTRQIEALNPATLLEAVEDLATLLVEAGGERRSTTPASLRRQPFFWTIDSALLRSSELLLREVPGSASLSAIATALGGTTLRLTTDPILCGDIAVSTIGDSVFRGREVDRIVVHHDERRLDLRWVDRRSPTRWLQISDQSSLFPQGISSSQLDRLHLGHRLKIRNGDVEVSGLRDDELGVAQRGEIFLTAEGPLRDYLVICIRTIQDTRDDHSRLAALVGLSFAVRLLEYSGGRVQWPIEELPTRLSEFLPDRLHNIANLVDIGTLGRIVFSTNWRVFDTSKWERRD